MNIGNKINIPRGKIIPPQKESKQQKILINNNTNLTALKFPFLSIMNNTRFFIFSSLAESINAHDESDKLGSLN